MTVMKTYAVGIDQLLGELLLLTEVWDVVLVRCPQSAG
jgi:hypothetical protein